MWNDILTWRSHMFQLVSSSISPDNPIGSRMHDTPWTIIKFASISRKLQLTTVCLTSLAKLYAFSSMDATDAFNKLREQIKTCLQTPMEIRAALNIIASTNLDYFNNEQKVLAAAVGSVVSIDAAG